jgi:hypothetical protein
MAEEITVHGDTAMTEIYVFIGIAVIIAVLIIWTVLRNTARNNERDLFLDTKGFSSCDEREITDRVVALERNAEYDYLIRDPMKASHMNCTIFFYEKIRTRNGKDPYAVEEFLFPLPRKSREPFLLYLRPPMLKDGFTTKLIQRLASASWDAKPDGFARIELPEELQKSNIIVALAPGENELYDLVEPEQLTLLLKGSEHGILILRCNAGFCSVEYMRNLPGASPLRIWSFIEQMLDAASQMKLVAQ